MSKTAKEVEDKMGEINTIIPFHSVTFDNGREFTNHPKIAQKKIVKSSLFSPTTPGKGGK